MKKSIKIGEKEVGEGKPTLIIAEIGINHNGDMEIAKKLIDVAKDAGADIAKFQSWTAESLVSRKNEDYDRLKQLELQKEMHYSIAEYCKKIGIMFMSSAFDNKEVDFLDELGMPAHKVASCELTNLPFISYIAKKGKPIIMSVGFSNLEEIRDAIGTIKKEGNEEIILLHCIGAYPPKVEDMNLRFMQKLAKEFDVLVGLSDHSMAIEVSQAAVALGAVCVEKHITLNHDMEGFDHKASMEPDQLRNMIKGIRIIEKALGTGKREIQGDEAKLIKIMRKSVLAGKDIQKGEVISEDMLLMRRPGEGLPAKEIPNLVGKKAARDIKEGEYVKFEDLE